MNCCGRARTTAKGFVPRRDLPAAEAPVRHATVSFTYTGATRLVADGPVTRRRYRFEHPGATVEVDARDAASFAAIPNLRRAAA